MAHPHIRNHYLENIRTTIAKAREAASIPHKGLLGTVREIFVTNLLAPLLPPGFGIGRGQIIDSKGGYSAECDVIVYSRAILPPLLYDDKVGLFPIEACIYAIEVKSTITSPELDDAIEKSRKIWALNPMVEGDYRPRPTLFAFASDLTDKAELARYLEKDPAPYQGISNPATLVACVVGRSYDYWNGDKSFWVSVPRKDEFDEVIGFLSGVSNSLIKYTEGRKGLPFGQYLMHA